MKNFFENVPWPADVLIPTVLGGAFGAATGLGFLPGAAMAGGLASAGRAARVGEENRPDYTTPSEIDNTMVDVPRTSGAVRGANVTGSQFPSFGSPEQYAAQRLADVESKWEAGQAIRQNAIDARDISRDEVERLEAARAQGLSDFDSFLEEGKQWFAKVEPYLQEAYAAAQALPESARAYAAGMFSEIRNYRAEAADYASANLAEIGNRAGAVVSNLHRGMMSALGSEKAAMSAEMERNGATPEEIRAKMRGMDLEASYAVGGVTGQVAAEFENQRRDTITRQYESFQQLSSATATVMGNLARGVIDAETAGVQQQRLAAAAMTELASNAGLFLGNMAQARSVLQMHMDSLILQGRTNEAALTASIPEYFIELAPVMLESINLQQWLANWENTGQAAEFADIMGIEGVRTQGVGQMTNTAMGVFNLANVPETGSDTFGQVTEGINTAANVASVFA